MTVPKMKTEKSLSNRLLAADLLPPMAGYCCTRRTPCPYLIVTPAVLSVPLLTFSRWIVLVPVAVLKVGA
jgi:hypothetical protein